MYTLRTIDPEQGESNQIIGDFYRVVYATRSQDKFKELYKTHIQDLIDEDFVVGFLINYSSVIPLYSSNWYYIVNQDGGTFAKLDVR